MTHNRRSPSRPPHGASAHDDRRVAAAAAAAARGYTPPRLSVFGDLERLTTRVGSKGKLDGGGSVGKRRTGF